VYEAKATRSTLSTFNKVDRAEFNFVASVYRALKGFNYWVVLAGNRRMNPASKKSSHAEDSVRRTRPGVREQKVTGLAKHFIQVILLK